MLSKRLGIIFLFITILLGTSLADDENILPIEIGTRAPDFNLLGIDGKMYSLESFSDADILLIIFTANHCPTAQAYEDRIIRLVRDYKDKSVSTIAISSNNPEAVRLDEMGYTDLGDTFEEMKQRARDKDFNFVYLYDGDKQEAIRAYGAQATPHVFIFDTERKLRFVGRIDDSENIKKVQVQDTRNALNALIAGEKIKVEKTKAFGCSIKWASKIKSAREAVQEWNKEDVSLEKIDMGGIADLIKNNSENLRLLNIWATWCGPCITEFPELIDINRMYRHRAFELITLSADAPEANEKVLEFLTKNFASNTNYHFNRDDKYQLIEAVDSTWQGALPYTLIIKPGGEIIYKKQGEIEPLHIKKVIVEYIGRYYD